jgi:hypothetical protein
LLGSLAGSPRPATYAGTKIHHVIDENKTAMLDVHPQHDAAHTCEDLSIHIASIVFGLLIPIDLEQTVEAIHHHHERYRLLEDSCQEAYPSVCIMPADKRAYAAV